MGRPSRYNADTHPEQARNLRLLGLTETEICQHLEISETTLLMWKRAHPDFARSIKEGGIVADGKVVSTLLNRALGNISVPAVKVSFDKEGTPLYAPYAERLAPDTNAMRLWLFNRRPKEWRDRREVEVSLSVEQQIGQMSEAERLEQLRELQARAAGLLIEGEAHEVEPDKE